MKPIHFLIAIIGLLVSCTKNPTAPSVNESCLKMRAIIHINSTDTVQMKEVLTTAFALAERVSVKEQDSLIAVVTYMIGRQLERTKKVKEARIYYLKGFEIGIRQLPKNTFVIAQLYRSIGSTYYYEDDFKMALTYFDSVKINNQDSTSWLLRVRTRRNIAECYQRLKNLKAAEYIYTTLVPEYEKFFSPNEKAGFYNLYSSFLREIKAFNKAIEIAQKSVLIVETLIKEKKAIKIDSAALASSYYFIAFALQDSTAYKTSEKYYKKSLSMYKLLDDLENYRRGLMNMGLMYRYDKRFDKAEQILTQGIVSLDKDKQTDFNIVRKGKLFNNRSEVYLDLKQYKKALADQDSAIYYLTLYDRRASLTALLMSNRKSLLSTYENKAKIYTIYAENGSDTEGYQKALKYTQEIIKIADDIRADYFSDEAKLTLANDIKPALEKAISVCQKLYQKTRDKRYLEQAFGFVEYSKSMVLYENTRLENHLPAPLKAKGEALKKKEGALIAKNDVEKLQAYLRDKRQYREDIKALNKNHLASVAELQKALMLNNQTALIEYFVGDSVLFVFALAQNDVFLHELPKTKDFEQQIDNLRTEITQRKVVHDAANFEAQSYALYKYLLKHTLDTLPKNLNQLIIVPDGVLNYLPFDVLVKTDPSVNSEDFKNSKDFKDGNSGKSSKAPSFIVHHSSLTKSSSFQKSAFLLKDYTISYAYSANLLLEQKGMKKDAPELFAGFASKYADKDTTYAYVGDSRAALSRAGAYELAGTKEEVTQISTLIGGKSFLNEFSTEGGFKREANRYKILHFAMHSLTDDKDPALSRLLFTLTPKDTTNDNDLTAAELYTMNLNADLAVLSACNTGFGTLNKGEGVMSLARAFTFAGVPSTVTSLWEVPDLKTRDIMIDFYKNLAQGMAKDSALCLAKRKYVDETTESGTANPYFWAGFVAIGNMDAMDLSDKRPLSIWGILAGVVALSSLGFGFWFWRKKKAA